MRRLKEKMKGTIEMSFNNFLGGPTSKAYNIICDVPASTIELFQNGDDEYEYIDYSPEMEMDNNESMEWFIENVDIHENHILENEGTQIVIRHPDLNNDLVAVVDAGGGGDFFSHRFEVQIMKGDQS